MSESLAEHADVLASHASDERRHQRARRRDLLVTRGGRPTSLLSMVGRYTLDPGIRTMLNDLGIPPGRVLRRAELPAYLFRGDPVALSTDDYFRLWDAIDTEASGPSRAERSISSPTAAIRRIGRSSTGSNSRTATAAR